uniref:Uncharacterized protein n=1 Tax=Zea mays TaxID=4577 RepID=C0PI48_MAIZE|nr:unknown [Zea mays]
MEADCHGGSEHRGEGGREDMLMVSMMEGPRRTEKPTGVIFRKVCFYSWIKTHLASRVVVHRVLKADRKLWLAAG